MVKLKTYAAFSFLAAIAAIYHAFSSRGQFYQAAVYLSTSKISFVLLLNMGLVMMCVTWQLVKWIFLGSLREAEVERLNEQAWREVMEVLFAMTIFRQDISATFLAMGTVLLLIKALHWLAQKRIEYIETTPAVPTLSHIRIVSFIVFLLLVDCLSMYGSLKSLVQSRQASIYLLVSFEYTILATTTVSTLVKYVFHLKDMLMEGQWEKKAVYTFYLELVRDLLHLSLYILFFLVIFVNYGVPLYLIRELYETFRSFRIRVSDYIRYRKITSNMNERFPDATPEELSESDVTCIICREEMVIAKKLVCGHFFHVHCLRSWLERQHTCPTCRALVVPPENGSASAAPQHRSTSDRQPGPAAAETSTQASEGGPPNHHQARLQAASLAASMYKKSFLHPPNSYIWPPGFAVPSIPEMEALGQVVKDPNGGIASEPLQPKQHIPSDSVRGAALGKTNLPGSQLRVEADLGKEKLQGSLKVEESLVQSQIEVLQAMLHRIQTQLQDLRRSIGDVSKAEAVPTSSSGAAAYDCSRHRKPENANTD